MFGFIGKKVMIKIAGRTVNFCEFINIYGFHLHFNDFKILEDDVPELMVEVININNIMECCRFEKDVIFRRVRE